MALSSVPTSGPTIPAGAVKVSIKHVDAEAQANSQKVDVTDLSSTKREYAAPPLIDVGGSTTGATSTCSANGNIKGTFSLAPTPMSVTTGWICQQVEKTYEAGQYAKWQANWDYVEVLSEE